MLQILNTGAHAAQENMALDEKLLLEMDASGDPTLHLYQWEGPSATYGYFVDPAKYLDLNKMSQSGIAMARRPTGGGIIFHIWDLAFSFLLPAAHPRFSINTLDNYRFVNESVLMAMQELFHLPASIEIIPNSIPSIATGADSFCMARPTIYDVVYQERKIAGAAQRRRKNGYLHQGSISLALPDQGLLEEVLLSKDLVQAMMAYSFAPLGPNCEPHALASMREIVQKRLADNLRAKL
jgi:lipoate-protein ligase A